MKGSIEFIKAGELLIAPSIEYPEQYILRCIKCEEYYCLLETFLTHCLSHYGLEPKNDSISPLQTMCKSEDGEVDMTETVECYNLSARHGKDNKLDLEEICQKVVEDPLESLQQEHGSIETIVKEEPKIHEESYVVAREDTSSYQTDNDMELLESDYEDSDVQEQEQKETRNFVREFLKSKKSTTALISAYKNIPHMWNLKYAQRLRKSDERTKALQQIATELKNIVNEKVTTKQVSAVIFYLRLKYKERLKCEKEPIAEPANSKNNNPLPPWIFQQLEFLKPFMEFTSIVSFDLQQKDLLPEQVIKILQIYKKFSCLWDTKSLEYYCNNKRNEALERMTKIIEQEMAIQVKEDTLTKYLRSFHVHYCRERKKKRTIKSKNLNSDIVEHMSFLAEHVTPFICTECNKKFRSRIQMLAHLSKHDGKTHLQCSLCKHEFKSAEAYVHHVRRHMGDLGEKCEECGKKFIRPADLRNHMRSHTGDKPFFCEQCGASFSQQTSFLEHRRRHEKKFVLFCPICSKGFYKKTTLKIHTTKHYDIRNFECDICGKAFKTKKTLQNHVATHEEGKNHECDVCRKRFKNKINLLHHKRIHIYQLKGSKV